MRERIAALREWLERLLLWRVWERMLEIEFLDRSVALAGKAFVSFFPLVIVVAAFVPDRTRSSIISTVTARLGLEGDALATTREAFASSDDVRKATGLLGLAFMIFFVASFTTALQRAYLRAWRRPPGGRAGAHWRGVTWLLAMLTQLAVLGALRGALDGPLGIGLFAILTLAATSRHCGGSPRGSSCWAMSARACSSRPDVITGIALAVFAASATVWMPERGDGQRRRSSASSVSPSHWSPGSPVPRSASCSARVPGSSSLRTPAPSAALVRGGDGPTLAAGARPSLPPPDRELTLRDAFQSTSDS